jgi:hypothetical protein
VRRPSSTSASRALLGRWGYPAIACLSMVLGIGLIDHAVWSRVGPWNTPEWREKRSALAAAEHQGQSIDLLVVGDSTMTSGIFPSLIAGPHGFNLGRSALNPSELRPLLEQMDDWGVRPRIILLSITPFNTANDIWENRYATPLPDKLRALRESFYANPAISDPMFLPGKAITRGLLASALKSGPSALDAFKASPRSFDIAPDGTRVPRQVVRADINARFETDFPDGKAATIPDSYFNSIETFKTACEARGARVYWVSMPIHPAYDTLLRQRQPELWKAYHSGIAALFEGRILNLPSPIPLDDFQDGVHLTPAGAREFSRRLAALIPVGG